MTRKLYYDSAYIKTFDAHVVGCTPLKGDKFGVVLDETAFYPEGGGQPSDTGCLNLAHVFEVHEKGGEIIHTTDIPLEPGSLVTGGIDWERRFEHMQHHSGEHLFSGLIHRRFGYDNVGFHMGKEEVTVDFNGVLTASELLEIEAEANGRIYENIPVDVLYPSETELESIDYRSKKELTGQIRIVDIKNGDTCACCGTHVRSTGEIGIVKATSMINYKGGVRISILCGQKALNDYQKKQGWINELSVSLSSKPEMVAAAVERIKQESASKDIQMNALCKKLFEIKVQACKDGTEPLLLFEEDLNPWQLRQLCTLLYQKGKGNPVMVCSPKDGIYQYAMGSGELDVRIWGKELNRTLDGRGGGSALMVQGTFGSDEENIKKAFRALHRGESLWN